MKLGIIGAGIICKSHIGAIKRMPGEVELVAIADIVIEKARTYADEMGAKAYADYKEMLDKEELDAVIINLPHKLHRESTELCARRGIHVLCEKPMAATVEDCQAMIDVCRENKAKLMIGHIQHYTGNFIKMKEIIKSKEFGELVSIADTRNIYYFQEDRPRWFLNKEMAGGGIFINLGAHSIDRILWLSDGHIKRISGKAGYFEKGYEVEGNVQAFIELDNNVTATVTCIGYKVPVLNETILYFTDGAVKSNGDGFFVSKAGAWWEKAELDFRMGGGFVQQLKDFITSIKEDTTPPIPGEYGLEVIKAIHSVYSQS
jgi:predicted dehydrogenase